MSPIPRQNVGQRSVAAHIGPIALLRVEDLGPFLVRLRILRINTSLRILRLSWGRRARPVGAARWAHAWISRVPLLACWSREQASLSTGQGMS
jgi:hypothetical protein